MKGIYKHTDANGKHNDNLILLYYISHQSRPKKTEYYQPLLHSATSNLPHPHSHSPLLPTESSLLDLLPPPRLRPKIAILAPLAPHDQVATLAIRLPATRRPPKAWRSSPAALIHLRQPELPAVLAAETVVVARAERHGARAEGAVPLSGWDAGLWVGDRFLMWFGLLGCVWVGTGDDTDCVWLVDVRTGADGLTGNCRDWRCRVCRWRRWGRRRGLTATRQQHLKLPGAMGPASQVAFLRLCRHGALTHIAVPCIFPVRARRGRFLLCACQ